MTSGSPVPASAQYWPAYYGFIHAHTAYSIDYHGDKSDTPAVAFQYARDTAGLDWMAVSDHAESYIGQASWTATKEAADDYTVDGSFVAFRAFEYSNSMQGHVCVVNTESWTNWEKDHLISYFFDWLANYPEAVATFNHPGSYDIFNNEFYHFNYRSDIAPMMVGLEMLNSGSKFDSRDKGYDGQVSFLDEAIQKGWWLGSVSGDDAHDRVWGTRDVSRTGVLAEGLTRADLIDAFRARRFFTSEDSNAYVSFQMNGAEMGSRLTVHSAPTLNVYFSDPDGEAWTGLKVYKNGVVVAEESFNDAGAGTADVAVPLPSGTDYYYVRVEQSDGQRIQPAPIWLTRSATATVAAE
ncbi:MAG: CehA/McbA family metallohydrolase [Candidatus Schekmanbacteria bacterium]|nr:CehA/McbA family metallohydrolase [Candidatus Schekmanbacteria bacterium]